MPARAQSRRERKTDVNVRLPVRFSLIATAPAARARRGFTLLEILVALGAVVVVAVGLATIFRSVGDTVSAGRRLSRQSQIGKLLEQQLRADIESITRDGFLVVRQQYADRDADGLLDRTGANADVIPLFEGQEADRQRLRRSDEIIFFRKGTFQSQRAPLGDDTWRAKSNEAMIYYGHGQRRREDDPSTGLDQVREPKVNDANNPVATATDDVRLGRFIDDNPNATADAWSLLRKTTLLVPISTSDGTLPAGAIYDVIATNIDAKRDKESQIAGQPAAPSIFRGINRGMGPEFPTTEFPYGRFDDHVWVSDAGLPIGNNYERSIGPDFMPGPSLASGLVDVATTSLAEIRTQVLGYADTRPVAAGFAPIFAMPGELGLLSPAFPSPSATFSFSRVNNPTAVPASRPGTYESIDYMHGWMSNAFPGRAAAANGSDQFNLDGVGLGTDDITGVRPRYMPGAERLYDLLALTPGNLEESRELANMLADRRMLQSSVLLSNCTEFIVEWTFGEVDADGSQTGNVGSTIWYGPREIATAGPSVARDGVVGHFVYSDTAGARGNVETPVLRRDGSFGTPHAVTPRLIYGYTPSDLDGEPVSVTSYFGYVDPTFDPDLDSNGSADDAVDAAQQTLPWRWPSMIRMRVTVSDPIDKELESTFEYVFSLPAQ